MARKKIVFVIVEGSSDDAALGAILSNIFDANEVHVEIIHHDITTQIGVTPANIINKIADVVKTYAFGSHFRSGHFSRIIHLVDTDGAFIPNESIKEDPTADRFIYTTESISAKSIKQVTERNKQKKENLLKITRTPTVWNILYKVFYMSCNLEHVLFNELNCTDDEKEVLSFQFAKKYKNDIPGFLSFISQSDFSVCDDYLDSWDFIEQGLHSLRRYTNFGLCFKEEFEKQSNEKK